MTEYELADYTTRLDAAAVRLRQMAERYMDADQEHATRLLAKASGVDLALDYLRAYK